MVGGCARRDTMGRVDGKVAIVTGAGQGLGQASAELLAREGARVVVTDHNEATRQEVAASIRAQGGDALSLHHDVTSESDWESVIAKTVSTYRRLDVLVNNAGVSLYKTVEDTTLEEWRQLMSINLDAVYLGTKHAIGAMKQFGGGSIVNISSIEGLIGHPDLAAYNASKGGVRIFTKSAALHCGRIGSKIRVNSIHPGFVRTPLLDAYCASQPDPAAAERDLLNAHPIGRLGEPADIANGVLYLASDDSAWVTGTELVIDGGFTAQ